MPVEICEVYKMSEINSIQIFTTTSLPSTNPMLDILCDNKNDTLPSICTSDYKGDKNIQKLESDEIFNQQHFDSIKILFDPTNQEAVFPNHHVSKRGLGLLGIIGGFVLLLLFLAFLTCVRQRKLYQVNEYEYE